MTTAALAVPSANLTTVSKLRALSGSPNKVEKKKVERSWLMEKVRWNLASSYHANALALAERYGRGSTLR